MLATWARMPLFLKLVTVGSGLFLMGAVSLLLGSSWGVLLCFLGIALLVVGAELHDLAASRAGTDPVVDLSNGPSIIVRTYKGKQQSDAVAWFEADAADLAMDGYSPTTQSWAQGQWGCGAFLVALLLCIILVGILVFIYMLLVKPEGTLTVTYERVRQVPLPATANTASATPAPASIPDQIRALGELRDHGLLTSDEFEAKKRELLSRM